jgi:PAS domain S-box-containing protein
MHWQYTPYTILVFIAALISGGLALWGWRRHPAPGAGWFTALTFSAFSWALCYGLEMISTDLPATLLWSKMQYLGAVGLPVAWLALVLTYTGRRKWLSLRNVALLFVIPTITLALVWTNEYHELIWVNPGLETGIPFNTLSFTPGMWYWVNIAYAYALLVFSTILLVAAFARSTPLYRRPITFLLLFSLITWLGNLAYTVGLTPQRINLTPVTFSISGLLIAWGLFRYRILDIAPVARDVIVESMSDGVIVLDPQSRVVDLNPMAQVLIGHTLPEVVGQPLAQVLADWPALMELCHEQESAGGIHTEIALNIGEEEQRTFDLRVSPLRDQRGRMTGRLMLWHDITESKRVEAALRESEERFRSVAQSANDAIITAGSNGNIVSWNKGAQTIFGYREEEVLGQSLSLLMPDRYKHAHQEGIERLSSTGKPRVIGTTIELEGRRKDGDEFSLDLALSSWQTGGETFYSAIIRDITERKRAAEALAESEQRYRQIIEEAVDIVYTTNFRGYFTYVSPPIQKLTGYPPEELVGTHYLELIPVEWQEKVQSFYYQQFQERERETRLEFPIVTRTGEEKWVEQTVTLLIERDRVTGFQSIVRDVTERKRAEEALALAHEQVLEASRLKSQLLANVSHDLRSPLGSILGYTEMLQAGVYGSLAEQQYTALTEVIDSTEQLLNFVNNLLGQAQIESGKVVLNVRPFAPVDLLEAIQSTVKALAQAKGLEVISKVAPDMPTNLSGDLYWLRQILVNLVSNAAKFTDQGTVKVQIYQSDENYWAIKVSDTGCGIPAEAQSYIFEPFRQVEEVATRKQHTGSGLGLSIVKQLTAFMGGRVTLTSEVGQGSTFTVLLPLTPVQEEAT